MVWKHLTAQRDCSRYIDIYLIHVIMKIIFKCGKGSTKDVRMLNERMVTIIRGQIWLSKNHKLCHDLISRPLSDVPSFSNRFASFSFNILENENADRVVHASIKKSQKWLIGSARAGGLCVLTM